MPSTTAVSTPTRLSAYVEDFPTIVVAWSERDRHEPEFDKRVHAHAAEVAASRGLRLTSPIATLQTNGDYWDGDEVISAWSRGTNYVRFRCERVTQPVESYLTHLNGHE